MTPAEVARCHSSVMMESGWAFRGQGEGDHRGLGETSIPCDRGPGRGELSLTPGTDWSPRWPWEGG